MEMVYDPRYIMGVKCPVNKKKDSGGQYFGGNIVCLSLKLAICFLRIVSGEFAVFSGVCLWYNECFWDFSQYYYIYKINMK